MCPDKFAGDGDHAKRSIESAGPWHATIVLLALAGLLTAAALVSFEPAALIVTLPIALTVPGLALLTAAVDRASTGTLLTTLAFAVVVTVALYIVVALVLSVLGLALTRTAFLVATDGVIVSCCAYILIAGHRVARPSGLGWREFKGSLLPLIAVATAAGAVLGIIRLPEPDAMPYQALYLTDQTGRTPGLQAGEDVGAGATASVGLSVENHSDTPRTDRLTAALGATAWPAREVEVPAGGTWSGYLRGPTGGVRCEPLEVRLSDAASGRVITKMSVHLQPPSRLRACHR